ncbi:pectin acetylesterase 5-like isoform X1 [Phoenix dactylifera]|uniref:Pectin acetylesterase n=1 Tax=Phoenix dactylifera TaxID=42345 RepID=A0A8B7D0A3_PHODC|nr:pectin acetylesterase 5-like isoform X1 [Phoenix dactylifera]
MVELGRRIRRFGVWIRRGGTERAIAGSGLAVLLLAVFITVSLWGRERRLVGPSGGAVVDLTLLENADEKGALCLDGSPPGYHVQKGFGSGSDSWLLHLEGGGWCNSVESCTERTMTRFGSSRYMEREAFVGILSNIQSENPDFYNWNKVKVRYCDGASFAGEGETEVQNGKKLYFRGLRIWKAIMQDLLLKGLENAKEAFLTGCSAGGLATFIHCDDFRALLPKEVTVKCLADAGFFIDEKDISGKRTIRSFYNDVVRLQNVGKNLPKECISRMEASQCFFPEEIVNNINTPLFILNSAYDSWQVQHILAPEESDSQQLWRKCKMNIHDCDSSQIEVLQGFRNALLKDLREFQKNSNGGMLINSCFIHCYSMTSNTWHSLDSPKVNNKTIAEAIGDWYFNRREVKDIDCPYPCNPTCVEPIY